mmetsp:Transcript_58757/g.97565  ORF Transcript_58757/g.97565 Transcript_58757/m.97565 type:complete len:118 (-) Transcript_58757:408-761(-)
MVESGYGLFHIMPAFLAECAIRDIGKHYRPRQVMAINPKWVLEFVGQFQQGEEHHGDERQEDARHVVLNAPRYPQQEHVCDHNEKMLGGSRRLDTLLRDECAELLARPLDVLPKLTI